MIRVLVVEERQAVRDGFRRLLAAAGEITVIGEAALCGDGIEVARRVDCDLLVVGLGQGCDGVDKLRQLKHALPGLHVLAVGSAAGTAVALETIVEGASGYLDMSRAREDLVKAVRAVCRGTVFVSAATREPRGGPASAA